MAATFVEAPELMQDRSKVGRLLLQLSQAQTEHSKLVELGGLFSENDPRHMKVAQAKAMLDELQGQADSAITEYAKLSCRALCDMIQDKLPVETRSQIYEEVLGPKCNLLLDSLRQIHPSFSDVSSNQYWNGHIYTQQYVGANALKEMAETWYRTTSIVIPCYREFDNFHSVKLLSDMEDGWMPTPLCFNRIKNLAVHIDPELFQGLAVASDMLDDSVEMFTYDDDDGFPGRECAKEFVNDMDCLSRFCPGTKITIVIYYSHRVIRKREDIGKEQLLAGLQFLFPALSKLRDRGMRIEALIDQTSIDEHFEFSAESWAYKFMASG